MVADALSRKVVSMSSLAYIPVGQRLLASYVQDLDNQFMRLEVLEPSRVLACMVSRYSLYERIREHQYDDPIYLYFRTWCNTGQICVPNVDGLHELILKKAKSSPYSIHRGAAKMYQNLRQHYWWRRMNNDMVGYVARCLNYQQVKYKHQRPSGLLQRLEIPERK
ncbi:uncharacterized protein [Nicotiana sylvestris]|uniref:uncharacterized protein n=1 Tax=Nicotiana sylvestris TaxID=4096 RepID=UPI00388CBD38